MTLLGATTLSQSGSGSNSNKGVFHIPQSSSITGTSPSNCLVSYPGHSFGESYPSAEKQLVYSTAPADWAKIVSCPIQDTHWGNLTPLHRSSWCILQPQLTGQRLFCVIYPGHSLEDSYPSAEKQLVYSTAPADWATFVFHFILINSLGKDINLFLLPFYYG